MRRNNRFLGLSGVAMVLFLFLLFPCLYAQDAIPALSRPLEPLRIPGETKEMHRGMRLITVHDSLPASFTHSLDNVIEDENRSLSPFFQKLNDMTGPVRIVHIGDSHVRGHLYPLITRRGLEHDFGAEAVYPDTISYRTEGLAHETGEPGIVYHMLGINGATSVTFSDDEKIKKIAEEIFNNSLENPISGDYSINLRLAEYENSIFKNDTDTQCLLENRLNYHEAVKSIEEDCCVNLKWLKNLSRASDLISMRENLFLKYPIEKVLLVEGLTEEILLPAFSKYLGYDFYQKGIQVIPAGGKNQVVKMYYKLIEELKIPVFLLLDKDAEDNIRQIKPKLRDIDKIHLVSCGEFEDLLPKSLIIKTLNMHFANFTSISESDLDDEQPEVKNLENIFKTKGLHEFKKAEFAKLVRANIKESSDISAEIAEIIKEISESNKTLDSKFCSC